MSNVQRITIALLLIITIALALVSIYVAYRSSQQSDISISGFGQYAKRDLYENVSFFLGTTECIDFIDQSTFNSLNNPLLNTLLSTQNAIEDLGILEYLAKSCIFQLENENNINFYIYTYNFDSNIDESKEALYNRINNFDRVIDDGSVFSTDYFFGVKEDQCVTHLFHLDNEFEYIRVEYEIKSVNCEELIPDNELVSKQVSKVVDDLINRIKYVTELETSNE